MHRSLENQSAPTLKKKKRNVTYNRFRLLGEAGMDVMQQWVIIAVQDRIPLSHSHENVLEKSGCLISPPLYPHFLYSQKLM